MEKLLIALHKLRAQERFANLNRGFYTSPEIIGDLKAKANDFIDFIIDRVENGTVDTRELSIAIVRFVHSSNLFDDLETEEREWLHRELGPAVEIVGIDRDTILD